MYDIKMDQIYNIGAHIGVSSVDEDGLLHERDEMEKLVDSRFRLYEAIIREINVVSSRQADLADKYKRLNKTLWRVRRELKYADIHKYILSNFRDLVITHGFKRVKRLVMLLSSANLSITEEQFETADETIVDYCLQMKIP